MGFVWFLILSCPCILVIHHLLKKKKPRHLGIYSFSTPLYHLKYIIFYLIYTVRKISGSKGKESGEAQAGYGVRSRNTISDMDTRQNLDPDYPLAVDAVYFNACNEQSEYLVAAAARRHHGMVQTVLHIRIPGIGFLCMPHLPDTRLYEPDTTSTDLTCYGTDGLEIEPEEPMKQWRVRYQGSLRMISENDIKSSRFIDEGRSKEVEVSVDLEWRADTDTFDYDIDMHPRAICRAIATEEWTREFFDKLKRAHQTHYEQFGTFTGKLEIKDLGVVRDLKLRGVRDHSYGNYRDWKDLHRYTIFWMHLRNGTAICMGTVCFPQTLSRLVIGYKLTYGGDKFAITDCDWDMSKHGEREDDMPDTVDFNFKATDNIWHHARYEFLPSPWFYMGSVCSSDDSNNYHLDAKVYERFAKCNMDGEEGWGVSEWEYRQYGG